MKKETELSFEDLQRYKELQEYLFPLVKEFVKHTTINKEYEYHIDAVYVREYKLSVVYICLNDPYVEPEIQYYMDIPYDVLLEYVKNCKNK